MTIQEIQERVDDIAEYVKTQHSAPGSRATRLAYASERAHEIEDGLRADFLAYVRDNPTDPELGAKAALVLSTSEIKFHRWYA